MAAFTEWLVARYNGLIDLQGVDRGKLGYIQILGKFKHTYKNKVPCRGYKIDVPKSMLPKLEKATKKGYFSLLFNTQEIIVVFHDKSIKFRRTRDFKNTAGFREAQRYAKKEKIPAFYIDELGDTLWSD